MVAGAGLVRHKAEALLNSDHGQPLVSGVACVGGGDTESAVVDVPVVEMLEKGWLVRRAELGQMNLITDDDSHGGTWGCRAFPFA